MSSICCLDLGDARLDVGLLAGAGDDGGVILGDGHLLGTAEHVERDVLELDAEILGDHLTAGEHGDVLQHGLAAIAEARRLDRGNLEPAAQLVDHERGKRLALDVLGDDQDRLAGLHHLLEQGKQRLHVGELLLVDENVGVLELDAHLVGVGNEIGGNIATVELHALDHFKLGLERLRLFDGDHAVIADLLHGLGDHGADLAVAIGGDGADLRDLLAGGDLLGLGAQLGEHGGYGHVDAALQIHRVGAGRDRLCAFLDDGLRKQGRRGGAVAGGVGGLRGDLAHHLRAHILELVLELDLLRHRHAVLGDAWGAERFLEHDIAALGAERHLDRIGQDVDAAEHALAGVLRKFYFLSCHGSQLQFCRRPEVLASEPRRAGGNAGLSFEGCLRPPPQDDDIR